jgi:succinate dehydrogenase hydrophobic anchor subunit
MDSSDAQIWMAIAAFLALFVLAPIAAFIAVIFVLFRLPIGLLKVIRDGSEDGRMTPAAVIATVVLAVLTFVVGLKAVLMVAPMIR